MTAPSPDLREALATVEQWRTFLAAHRWGLVPDDAGPAFILADEIYRLRAELADEGTRRLALAATLESDWAELNAAMMPVVRAAVKWRGEGSIYTSRELRDVVEEFRATGFLPDIELEDSER